MKSKPTPKTYSFHQDLALAYCREHGGTCPFGCGKDGAPNCYANVIGYDGVQCEPGRHTAQQAGEYAAWVKLLADL